VGRGDGRKAGEKTSEIIKVRAFFQFEVKVLFGEVEVGQPVLIHEFDDSADFLKFHDKQRFGV
jgi:hypothetical protein